MRAEKKGPFAASDLGDRDILVMDVKVEQVDLVVEEVNTIQHASSESKVVSVPIDKIRSMTDRALQIPARGPSRGGRENHEVNANRMEQKARRATPKIQSDPRDQLDRDAASALMAGRPSR